MQYITLSALGFIKFWFIRLIDRDITRKLTLGGLSPWRAREREPVTGVWGRSPQRGPGAEPLVRGSGADSFFVDARP